MFAEWVMNCVIRRIVFAEWVMNCVIRAEYKRHYHHVWEGKAHAVPLITTSYYLLPTTIITSAIFEDMHRH